MPHLGEFLRARRALVAPAQHGLPNGSRRTPGLRREEVAMLASISTAYYVRLEQGRDVRPSTEVLDALAAALLLDEEANAYLRALVGPPPPRGAADPSRPETAAPGLVALMEGWTDTPALLYDRHLDLLAVNSMGRALFGWLGDETNLLRAIFLDPAARVFYRDWALIAEGCVAALRIDCARRDDRRLVELVGELSVRSSEFASLWSRHEVRAKRGETKHFEHPILGPLSLSFENLTVANAPGQHLVVYHAEPGGAAEEALSRLRNTVEAASDSTLDRLDDTR
ncbi:helix-turn-helix domain-containing protein [Mycobacterium yunnanensis]|uniref:Helix-turn-helix domain-containing protein n=1 Tax=Mycobacterium yunnanensis TaxID=368477 RepID=A0A9X2Z9J8_9MYCO|nr:helix-turn-helix transcriptional regulator [Mycobacterium yunnanensis]MCV7424464.1 helix-turn-helix domain-containing protein [Mycobacterium yunnanensis]